MGRGVSMLALVVAASCALACGTSEQSSKRVASILGGRRDVDRSGVIAIGRVRDDVPIVVCTGVAIAPNLILTARHCVVPDLPHEIVCGQTALETILDPRQLQVVTDSNGDPGWQSLSEIVVPPGRSDICGADIALLRLKDELAEARPYEPRLGQHVEAGEQYSVTGFGVSETGFAGERRTTSALQVECVGLACGAAVASTEWQGEDGICDADSGSPAFDDEMRVIGVASRTPVGCTDPVFTQLGHWGGWLASNVLASPTMTDPPAWTATATDEDGDISVGQGDAEIETGNHESPISACYSPGSSTSEYGRTCDATNPCSEACSCAFQVSAKEALCTMPCDGDQTCPDGSACDRELKMCFPKSAFSHHANCAASGADAEVPSTALGIWIALLVFAGWRRAPLTDRC